MRWRPQAELMDRSFLRSGPCRERHDIRKLTQRWQAASLGLQYCKGTQLRQSWAFRTSLRSVHIILSLLCGEQKRQNPPDGRRFIVHADEKLSAFVELEREVLTVTFYLESIQW